MPGICVRNGEFTCGKRLKILSVESKLQPILEFYVQLAQNIVLNYIQ